MKNRSLAEWLELSPLLIFQADNVSTSIIEKSCWNSCFEKLHKFKMTSLPPSSKNSKSTEESTSASSSLFVVSPSLSYFVSYYFRLPTFAAASPISSAAFWCVEAMSQVQAIVSLGRFVKNRIQYSWYRTEDKVMHQPRLIKCKIHQNTWNCLSTFHVNCENKTARLVFHVLIFMKEGEKAVLVGGRKYLTCLKWFPCYERSRERCFRFIFDFPSMMWFLVSLLVCIGHFKHLRAHVGSRKRSVRYIVYKNSPIGNNKVFFSKWS